jgi:hypothetical protein
MYLDRIKNAQRLLRAAAGYRGPIDGQPGQQTLAAVQRVAGVEVLAFAGNWAPPRRAVAAAQLILERAGHDPGPVDGFWGSRTDAAFDAWRGETLPARGPDRAERFGPAGSAACTAGVVRVPWRMVLAWDEAQVITSFRCHELVAGSAQRAFDRIAAAHSLVQIRELGLHLYGGCFNHRTMRGGASLSTHAYGIAIDFDPARNRLRGGRGKARLAQPDAARFWDIWEDEGWTSLGREKDFDWMHVQAVPL